MWQPGDNQKKIETVRPEFELKVKTKRKNPVTLEQEPYVKKSIIIRQYFVSAASVLFMVWMLFLTNIVCVISLHINPFFSFRLCKGLFSIGARIRRNCLQSNNHGSSVQGKVTQMVGRNHVGDSCLHKSDNYSDTITLLRLASR